MPWEGKNGACRGCYGGVLWVLQGHHMRELRWIRLGSSRVGIGNISCARLADACLTRANLALLGTAITLFVSPTLTPVASDVSRARNSICRLVATTVGFAARLFTVSSLIASISVRLPISENQCLARVVVTGGRIVLYISQEVSSGCNARAGV